MPNFTFNCSKCGTPIEADDEWRGQQAQCPDCNETIAIPVRTLAKAGSPKKKFSVLSIALVIAIVLVVVLGSLFFISPKSGSTASSSPLSRTSLKDQLTVKMIFVSDDNQDQIPFSNVLIYNYSYDDWDTTLKAFELAVKMPHLLPSPVEKLDALKGLVKTSTKPILGAEFRNGTYTFENLPAGKYVLTAIGNWKNYTLGWAKTFEKQLGQPLTLTLTNDGTPLIVVK